MTNRRDFLLSIAGAAAVAPLAVNAQMAPKAKAVEAMLSEAFLAQLPQLMEWANVPGLAIAIVKNGQPAWAKGFGVKKSGEQDPATPSTLLCAASLSKVVFAYAILRMRDEKLIDLDRPLWNYLPNPDLPEGQQAKLITARHALSHSTGLQNWRFNRDSKLEFAFKPGERFQYSGEGFYYLMRVMETITGRGFEEYLQERVFKPLGMVNSTFTWNPASQQLMSWGHNGRMIPSESFNAVRGKRMIELEAEFKKPVASWKHEDALRAHLMIQKDAPPFPNFLLPNAAGSLISSVEEYARFMSRLLSLDVNDQQKVSPGSLNEMMTPQTRINSAISWGLGVGLENYGGRSMFWHWGDNGVFKTFMMGERATGNGIVVFTNSQNGHRMWQRIVAEAMGRDRPAFYFFMT